MKNAYVKVISGSKKKKEHTSGEKLPFYSPKMELLPYLTTSPTDNINRQLTHILYALCIMYFFLQ